ncbi:ATP-grasp domain-containing protein [Acetobacter sp. DsW_063]|uniref:ATP-grasp domain-containing protein n=1 Tax=Acetobacter sp. DsW_063 TaxID=1514894 RepID=UPI001E628429|nr:ATP-grasp domain-containing protein [Acetobacter sp. DsW_063]
MTFMPRAPREFAASSDVPDYGVLATRAFQGEASPKQESRSGAARETGGPVSFFEFWPGWLFYTPIVAYWIMMGLRYRDFGLPTAANPRIATGGLCGESKTSILDMAGPVARPWIAPYVILDTDSEDLKRAEAALASASLSLPVVVKPDIGCNGTGVKLVRTREALADALAAFPRGVRLIIQRLIPYEHEAGLFYIRHPDEPTGRISSITYKDVPFLTGDGVSTVEQLLLSDPRTRLVPHLYRERLSERLTEVLPQGAGLPLVFTGNHCKGSVFRNGATDITPALVAALDRIMTDIPDFHFGRVDVKFESVDALRRGEGFEIIEINGVGSEATHIWDATTTLREAYATQFHHYGESFRIGAKKKRAGWKSCSVREGVRLWREQRRLMRSYPLND